MQTLPPSLKLMLRLRFVGLSRRVQQGLSSPRKALLSSLAILLACVWLGNAIASILFREPYEPETFRRGFLLSLFGYGIWPFLRCAASRPEEEIEWSPAEKEFLLGGPFSRKELIVYRLHVILTSTVVKSLSVSLLLMPDLDSLSLGFLGVLLALSFLELTRLATEVFFWGLPEKTFRIIRLLTLGSAAALALYCAIAAIEQTISHPGVGPVAFSLIINFFQMLKACFDTPVGYVLTAPLSVFVVLVASAGVNGVYALNLAVAVVMLTGMYVLLLELDRRARTWTSDEERVRWKVESAAGRTGNGSLSLLPRVPRWGGAGALAWRQFTGARTYASSLIVSMVIPAVLSSLPLLMNLDPVDTFINVAGSLAFYSFLLFPAALKFDFRRDCDRLAILKTLPIPPLAATIGQLATPIGLTLMVQVAVLCFAYTVTPVPLSMLAWALMLLLPVNMIIFGMENWFFLIYPHRLNQEGVQIFLRSILMFTAKGLLFAGAMTLIFLWGMSCRAIAGLSFMPAGLDHRTVFAVGILLMTTFFGGLLVWLVSRAYRRFDPSMDLPS